MGHKVTVCVLDKNKAIYAKLGQFAFLKSYKLSKILIGFEFRFLTIMSVFQSIWQEYEHVTVLKVGGAAYAHTDRRQPDAKGFCMMVSLTSKKIVCCMKCNLSEEFCADNK